MSTESRRVDTDDRLRWCEFRFAFTAAGRDGGDEGGLLGDGSDGAAIDGRWRDGGVIEALRE